MRVQTETRKMWVKTRLKTHNKFGGGAKAGHLMPCVHIVQRGGQHTSTNECLDEERRAPEELTT